MPTPALDFVVVAALALALVVLDAPPVLVFVVFAALVAAVVEAMLISLDDEGVDMDAIEDGLIVVRTPPCTEAGADSLAT